MKEVSLEITHDCALKCIFCSSSADHPSPSGELSFKEIKSVLDYCRRNGATEVSISGGEPLLHPQFEKIIEYAHNKGYRILLYTSGVIIDKSDKYVSISKQMWRNILNLAEGNIIIIFDLQGPISEVADLLMGYDGAFSIIEKSIINAIECGAECQAHTVPMKANYNHIFSIADYAEKIGLTKISFLRFVPQGRSLENLPKLELSPKEFLELQFILLKLLKDERMKRRKIAIRLGHPIDFLFLIDSEEDITSCRGGTDAPLILPNGDVHMCPAWKNLEELKAGNIRKERFSYIWEKSQFYVEFRRFMSDPDKMIHGKCKYCPYLIYCKGGCTAQRILYNDSSISFPDCMYLSPDPLCPFIISMLRGI
ncbi:MAG: radical SAM protein [Candidatus Hodarchaeales archaeon]